MSEVFSVSPSENESGNFSDILPFIVLEKETLPWEHPLSSANIPWVALMVISSVDQGVVEQDMTVSDLLNKRDDTVYFPPAASLPAVSADKGTDFCHVIDMPLDVCRSLMPSPADLPYLCHARAINLGKTEDDICAKDGYFSVVMANRFPRSGNEPVQNTVHLVSLLGFMKDGVWSIPDTCKTVRMVSLYHWSVFSQTDNAESFSTIVDRLRQNCGVINNGEADEMRKQGYRAKKHWTRSGEETWSIYRSPLIPYNNTDRLPDAWTADGRLIYDKKRGVLDVTYAAAWQLGRLITLSKKAVAAAVFIWRRTVHQNIRKMLTHHTMNYAQFDVAGLTKALTRERILCRE
jgi:hypothetical protein